VCVCVRWLVIVTTSSLRKVEVCVCACLAACVHLCKRACVRVCVHLCLCVYVGRWVWL
jgi:hypothetical protein